MNDTAEKIFVEDIREGQEIGSPFLLDDIRLGQTRNGKPFVGLKIKDRSGQMEARVWDQAQVFFDTFKNGAIAWVRAAAESFQGQVQLKVLQARPLEPDQVDMADFMPASPYDTDQMYAELIALVGTVADPHLRGLLEDVFTDPETALALRKAPAAKRFHHAYMGGLLEHSLSVGRAAVAVSRLYPMLNHDLLLAGALLHDLGKLREFDQGITGDYTDEGRMLGHLVIGVQMLEDKLRLRPDFPANLALLLKHLIVSHHGEYELGSPKKPKILEALALHQIDDLDAKMNGIGGFIQRHADAESGWTDWNRLMERFFYRPDLPVSQAPPAEEYCLPDEAEGPAGNCQGHPAEEADRPEPEHKKKKDENQLSFLQE